jgi:hypothetical protein
VNVPHSPTTGGAIHQRQVIADTLEAIGEGEANGTAGPVWYAAEQGIVTPTRGRCQHKLLTNPVWHAAERGILALFRDRCQHELLAAVPDRLKTVFRLSSKSDYRLSAWTLGRRP